MAGISKAFGAQRHGSQFATILTATRPIMAVFVAFTAMGAAAPPRDSNLTAALSDSDLAAIKSTLIGEWHGSGAIEFAKIIASEAPGGTVTVCGFERAKVVSGNNTGMQPFVGVLTRQPWRFKVTASSDGGDMAIAVLARCRGVGLQLIPE